MRVIAGKYKGRRLKTLPGARIRPIPDRLKESVFSILHARLQDARVLDLCAGSGAVGIEALSRGAERVTFVDDWMRSLRVIKQNLETCGIRSSYHLLHRDALVALHRLVREGERFDLVFFDPPYASEIYNPVMKELGKGDVLRAGALVLVMHHAKLQLNATYGVLTRCRQLKQGENVLSFYQSIGQ